MTSKQFVWMLYPMFLFDFANTILLNTGSEFYRISIFYRALIEFLILTYFLSKRDFRKQFVLLVCLSFCFIVGHSILYLNDSDLAVFQEIIELNKFLFFIILSIPFLYYENDESFAPSIKRLFELFFVVNSMFIIVGFVFHISMFSSYYDPAIQNEAYVPRFGYKGLIPAVNELTGAYFWGLAYYFRSHFILKEKKKIAFALVVIGALLTGTKGCIGLVLGFTALYLYFHRRTLLFRVYLPALLLLIVYWGWDIIKYLTQNVFLYLAYFYERGSLITFVLSSRDVKLEWCFEYIARFWTPANYIFGGFNRFNLSSEMDIFDIYFFWGIGMVPFLIYYFRLLFHTENSTENSFVFTMYFLIIFAGGHILGSAIVPFFMLSYIFTAARPTVADSQL